MIRLYSLIVFMVFTLALISCKGENIHQQTVTEVIEKNVYPKPMGYVSDYVGLLSVEQRQALEKQLIDYEQKSTNEIAIVILDSVSIDKDFANYCINLSNAWGVGKAGKNNGLMFIMDAKNYRMRINTGEGTEKVLTDEICGLVMNEVIIPNFKRGDYYEGLKYGVDDLIQIWEDEIVK